METTCCLDLTHLLEDGLAPWPGDPAPVLRRRCTVSVDGFSDFHLETGMHVGTHMDGPGHMLETGKLLSEFPVSRFTGAARVLDVQGEKVILPGCVTTVRPGDIVLFCTGWDGVWGKPEYFIDYPVLAEETAKHLCEVGVGMVGMDTPGPDRFPFLIHKMLLSKEILILENLKNLRALPTDQLVEVTALPLKTATDGGLARVMAKWRK